MPHHNCPFYGCFPFGRTRQQSHGGSAITALILLPTLGNQCALIFEAHSPCKQEIEDKPIDWRICPTVREIREELSHASSHR